MPLRRLLAFVLITALALPAFGAGEASTSDAENANGATGQMAGVANNLGRQLAEVVVTAQKRASTVQNTPISISAVSGEDLLIRGATF